MPNNNPETGLNIRKVGKELSIRKKGKLLLLTPVGKKLSIRQVLE